MPKMTPRDLQAWERAIDDDAFQKGFMANLSPEEIVEAHGSDRLLVLLHLMWRDGWRRGRLDEMTNND